VGDFSGEGGVVHEKEVDLSRVVDHEFLVAVGHQVAGLFVGSISDRGHGELAFETSSDSVVNTFGFAPCLLDRCVSVGLMPNERLGAFLDNRDFGRHGRRRGVGASSVLGESSLSEGIDETY